MNETDTKKFKKMQNLARTAPLSEMERWLIDRLESEVRENERLRQELVETHAGWSKTNDMRIRAEQCAEAAEVRCVALEGCVRSLIYTIKDIHHFDFGEDTEELEQHLQYDDCWICKRVADAETLFSPASGVEPQEGKE